MNKNVKINYKTADPDVYDTICPTSKAIKASFDNDNEDYEDWGDHTIHIPLSSTNALNAFDEIQNGISRYGKVCTVMSGISGSVIGLVGYGNMAIYVTSANTNVLNVYNYATSTNDTITLPEIGGVNPVVKDVALVKIDGQKPKVGTLCYVGSSVYYIAYDIKNVGEVSNVVTYALVSSNGTASLSSRFLRTKKEIVIINGTTGKTDNTYGDLGRVMRSTDGDTFTYVSMLDGSEDLVYLPLSGSMYCGDDVFSSSYVVGNLQGGYRALMFTIDSNGLTTPSSLRFTQNFNPLGRDLNTGDIMFSTSTGWWKIASNGSFSNFTTFQSPKIPTSMVCVNGLKITNAGYYYNAQGLTTGKALIDGSGNSIVPSASQSYLKLYPINDNVLFIYSPAKNAWYRTALDTTI